MKRKLSLIMAVVMIVSSLASMSVFAATLNSFDAAQTPTIAVRVDDLTASAADFGLAAGTPVYGVTPTISGSGGFMTLQLSIVYDYTKIKPFAGDYKLHTGTDAEAVMLNSTMTVDGVITNYKVSTFGKASMVTAIGISGREGTLASIDLTAAGTAYSTTDGDMLTYIMLPVDGYTPVAADFPVILHLYSGADSTEEITDKVVVPNPYVSGGQPTEAPSTATPVPTTDITVTYGANGSVNVNGSPVTSPYTVTVNEGETISAEIVPAEGYYVSKYTLDGVETLNTEEGNITLPAVGASLVVEFAEIGPKVPAIIQTATGSDGASYAWIDNYEYLADEDYGFILTINSKTVNGEESTRTETYKCSAKSRNGANSLGQFGVLINILNAEDIDYTLTAYLE